MPEVVGRLRTPRIASAPSSPAAGEMYYNTATNTLYWWNGTAWVSASGGSLDMNYKGAYPTGTPYTDGDIVVGADGNTYLCVKPTSAAPVAWASVTAAVGPPGPQGAQGPTGLTGPAGAGIPTVQNGKWLNGSGGTAVWASIGQSDLPGNLGIYGAVAPGKDMNNATAAGWYITSQDADTWGPTLNRPPTAYAMVQTYALSANYRQVAYAYGSLDIYQRHYAGGWNAWVRTQWTPDAAWKTVAADVGYQGGCSDYAVPYGPVKLRKLASGLVIMEGLMNVPGTTTAFQFPVGYRPGGNRVLIFHTATSVAQATETWRLDGAGNLSCQLPAGGAWASTAGIQFYAEA